jgi:hypothetical protein
MIGDTRKNVQTRGGEKMSDVAWIISIASFIVILCLATLIDKVRFLDRQLDSIHYKLDKLETLVTVSLKIKFILKRMAIEKGVDLPESEDEYEMEEDWYLDY